MELCFKTFVSVGNAKQHFSRLLNIIHQCADLLPKPIFIQRGHTPFSFALSDCVIVDFINMDTFVNYVANAELLILHAGAGSVMHSIRADKYPLVMPRRAKYDEIVNDHQVGFAHTLHEIGKAHMINDAEELINGIKTVKEKIIDQTSETQNSQAFEVIKNRIKTILR